MGVRPGYVNLLQFDHGHIWIIMAPDARRQARIGASGACVDGNKRRGMASLAWHR